MNRGKLRLIPKEFVYDTVEKKVYDLEFENQDYSPARSMRMGAYYRHYLKMCFRFVGTDPFIGYVGERKVDGKLEEGGGEDDSR